MRKPAFCICENKGADQRLCLSYIDRIKIQNFKPPTIFCDCTAWFVMDLVGKFEDRFSRNTVHFVIDKIVAFSKNIE